MLAECPEIKAFKVYWGEHWLCSQMFQSDCTAYRIIVDRYSKVWDCVVILSLVCCVVSSYSVIIQVNRKTFRECLGDVGTAQA